jgi:Cupin-like domain
MAEVSTLKRIQGSERFRSEFADTSVPIVVEGASATPALEKWSIPFLASRLEHSKLMVRFPDGMPAHIEGSAFFAYLSDPGRFESSRGPAYLADYHIEPPFDDAIRSALAEDVRFPLSRREEAWAEWITIYLGPPDTYTRLHQDTWGTFTWMTQLEGTKVWRLCAPGDMTEARAESLNPFTAPSLPCTFYEARLQRGDTIFVPPGWWHAVRNETTSLAVSGNYCTLEEGREALRSVENLSPPSLREVWFNTWTAVIARTEEKYAIR